LSCFQRLYAQASGILAADHEAQRGILVIQRSRDLISGQVTLEYFVRKTAEGWSLRAIEWVREIPDQLENAEPFQVALEGEDLPYGLQFATDGLQLEQNPLETTVLLLILEKIVKERRITEIAEDLNVAGLKTRLGAPWTPAAVFDLLPRLIEMGPKLLNSQEWQERRARTVQPS